jgi:hypothetical protein
MMSPKTIQLPSKWIPGASANRPMLPSETRTSGSRTLRKLPWARATFGEPREMLPWENRAANDWRGLMA